jgi:hypothetical protein
MNGVKPSTPAAGVVTISAILLFGAPMTGSASAAPNWSGHRHNPS